MTRAFFAIAGHPANWRAPAHLALLTLALQGAPIVSQALAAIIVPLAVMGQIRTIESALPIVILLGSLGASSLAVREVAAAPSDEGRQVIGRDLMLLPLAGTIALLAVASVMLWIAPPSWLPWIRSAVPLLPLALLVNVNRCLGGISQGWGRTHTVSVRVAAISCVAVVCHVSGGALGAADGWTVGRYVAELIMLSCFLPLVTIAFGQALWSPLHWRRFGRLIGGAVVLNFAFVARAAADALPLLTLVFLAAGRSEGEVGAFGIATLILTMAMLPIAVLSQSALPKLARAAAAKHSSSRRIIMILTGVGVLAMICVAVPAVLFARFLEADLKSIAFYAALLSLSIPLKAAAIGFGTRLIASARFDGPLKGNVIELAAIALICLISPSPISCGLAVIVGAALSLASLAWLDHVPMQRHRLADRS